VFDGFTFTSRRIAAGSRLRLVIAPVNSIEDARRVTVTLYHDRTHPSALFVPIGQAE
jgi:hypothetical protein